VHGHERRRQGEQNRDRDGRARVAVESDPSRHGCDQQGDGADAIQDAGVGEERALVEVLAARGPVFWCLPAALAQERRNISTASTRRDSLPVDGSPSLPKMLETYFSTARSVITSASAIP
jgi:hypothetical protein